jgi:hypothetical protein
MPEKDKTPATPASQAATPQAEPTLKAFVDFLDSLRKGGPIPFTVRTTFPSQEERQTMQDINDRLVGKRPVPRPRYKDACLRPLSVAFPPCSDVLLSLVKVTDTDEVTGHFHDYFTFCDHATVVDERRLDEVISQELLDCTKRSFPDEASPCDEGRIGVEVEEGGSANPCADYSTQQSWPPRWPPTWCLPPSCVTLRGTRHLYTDPGGFPAPDGHIRRLFLADLAWLFYFERMGIFQILGRILDEYAYGGGLPISNGGIGDGIRDDVIALVLEAMVRQTEGGTSSKTRDRNSSFRRCLNWELEAGRKLGMSTSVNAAFNTLFHKFIASALEFYRDKRLAVAIQGVTAPVAKTSVATLITLSDTISLLKKSFDSFDYGRSYANTLSGIVWTIAAMTVIRDLRQTLGIPTEYEQPYEYIPAAYDILVLRRPITPSDTNRYEVHRECANDARSILLDMEVVDHTLNDPGGELERWLSVIESKVEGYRTAYRGLTGVDLAGSGTPVIEHQAV